jgi:hypothetical protein
METINLHAVVFPIIVLFVQIDNESNATCDITTDIIVPCDRRSGCEKNDSGMRTRCNIRNMGRSCYAEEQSDQENIPNDISNMARPQQNCLEKVLYSLDFLTLHQVDHSLIAIHLHSSTILV